MDLLPDFSRFFSINTVGTSNLYEAIVSHNLPIKKIIVASSQFVYGQGKWYCKTHKQVFPKDRKDSDLRRGNWDPTCPICGKEIVVKKNTEDHFDPPNQYAISKFTQELIALRLGKLYNIPSVALRYSIVHGSRQTVKSAYSGALRQFVLTLLAGEKIAVYEDGKQLRDFVSVKDVATAHLTVMTHRGF